LLAIRGDEPLVDAVAIQIELPQYDQVVSQLGLSCGAGQERGRERGWKKGQGGRKYG